MDKATFILFFSDNVFCSRAHYKDKIQHEHKTAYPIAGLAVPVSGYSCLRAGLAVLMPKFAVFTKE